MLTIFEIAALFLYLCDNLFSHITFLRFIPGQDITTSEGKSIAQCFTLSLFLYYNLFTALEITTVNLRLILAVYI